MRERNLSRGVICGRNSRGSQVQLRHGSVEALDRSAVELREQMASCEGATMSISFRRALLFVKAFASVTAVSARSTCGRAFSRSCAGRRRLVQILFFSV